MVFVLAAPPVVSTGCAPDNGCNYDLPSVGAVPDDATRLVLLVDGSDDAPRLELPPSIGTELGKRLDDGGTVVIDIGLIQGVTGVDTFWIGPGSWRAKYVTDAEDGRRTYVGRVLGCLNDIVRGKVAVTPDTSTLDAVDKAVDKLRNVDKNRAMIIISGNGMDNTGQLDLRTPMAGDSPADSVVADLPNLPHLPGVPVSWFGLGQTRDGVRQLSSGEKTWLVSVWRGIVHQITGIDLREDGDSKPGVVSGPPRPPDAPFVAVPTPPSSTTTVGPGQPAPPSEIYAQALFGPDSAELLREAKDVLARYVEVARNPGTQICIIGHTATWGPVPGRITLSQDRAHAVANYLLSQGIPAERIVKVAGVGSANQVVPDLDADGNLIEEAAQRNRRIEIILNPVGREDCA
jgi:outer membrane protein OmpA-like peptidoglycan-associated protein